MGGKFDEAVGRTERGLAHVAAGIGREFVSTALTAAVWPLGVLDRGISRVSDRIHDRPTVSATPVLLLHGYAANKSNWMFVHRHLRDAGFGQVHAVNCNPFRHDIPTMAHQVTAHARDLMASTGATSVHLIGHSMGGIVARYAVQCAGLAEAATCVTIASPHGGSPVAAFGLGPAARDMRPGSPVLRRLHGLARPLPTQFTAYWGDLDELVRPHRARITTPALRAVNVGVPGEGHLSIMLSRRLASSIVTQLAAAEGLYGYGRPVAALGDASGDDGCEVVDRDRSVPAHAR